METLQDLFSDPRVTEIISNAIQSQKAVSFESDTVKITVIPDNNAISINLEYTESANFKEYLNTLPDEIFTEVCEMLGDAKLQQISKCIESDDVETVRSGIVAFKDAVRAFAANKLSFYKQLLK